MKTRLSQAKIDYLFIRSNPPTDKPEQRSEHKMLRKERKIQKRLWVTKPKP